MRTRTTHLPHESALIKGTLGKRPRVCVKILLGQGTIDDVCLTFSDSFCFEITTFKDQPQLVQQVTDWLSAYANKKPTDAPLPFRLDHASAFTKEALDALQRVGFGTTATYGDVAAAIDRARAVRAVGSVCHHNPFPIFIPCHRIISSQGLGGFAYPMAMKKELLSFESIFMSQMSQ